MLKDGLRTERERYRKYGVTSMIGDRWYGVLLTHTHLIGIRCQRSYASSHAYRAPERLLKMHWM